MTAASPADDQAPRPSEKIRRYHLKAVPVYAEKVEGDLTQLLDIAERWGCEVRVHPEQGITLTVVHGRSFAAGHTAKVGDWLMDSGAGKGVCTDEEFTASFEQAE